MPHENPNTDRSEPEDQPGEPTAVDELDSQQGHNEPTFQQKNVLDGADHQLEFFGSYTESSDGSEDTIRTIEHEFDVFTDGQHRTDDGHPTAVIEERELLRSEREGSGGEADLNETERIDLVLDIDAGLDGRQEKMAIEEYCEEWHRNRIEEA